ncbi:Glycoside hydrolase family 17 protein [Dioscorea alata]|uniref:Glycoside hydrolase family 17 protein n=1 Tax=Dioscorea alata TaxID=55571 RepID=A0ACB7VRG6_DIOAL|nr:Glycoside hydrolase family 17 protein [Dioscorea alata]
MRLYDPNPSILEALRGSNIEVMLDIPNTDLRNLASDPSAANVWVQTYIIPYSRPHIKFKYIAVATEAIPRTSLQNVGQYVLPAMRNIRTSLLSVGRDEIKVSTAVSAALFTLFLADTEEILEPIIRFLNSTGSPLLVNVDPYLSYINNMDIFDLNYALFTSPGTNLFDALLDKVYSALEKTGGSNVDIVVSESGWPSAGGVAASVDNAQTYNQNLINHVRQGTPKGPRVVEVFLYEMFNENQKSPEYEKHFGLFNPDGTPVYVLY